MSATLTRPGREQDFSDTGGPLIVTAMMSARPSVPRPFDQCNAPTLFHKGRGAVRRDLHLLDVLDETAREADFEFLRAVGEGRVNKQSRDYQHCTERQRLGCSSSHTQVLSVV